MFDPSGIPMPIGYYLAGFADGEGSFNVSFRPRSDYRIPWKISLCFNISQRERLILEEFRMALDCGTMRQRKDGVWYYEVNHLVAIRERVIPFFDCFPFRSFKKHRDFEKFKELARILSEERIDREVVMRILRIRSDMNDGGKRRYSDQMILEAFEKSSETRRRTPRAHAVMG